jgi:hypothetical protein
MKRWLIVFILVTISVCVLKILSLEEIPASTTFVSKIDRNLQAAWKEEDIKPAPLSSDEEFLRRVYLDLTGRIPPSDEARSFLKSNDPNKRARLIEQLLNSDEYAEYFASQWTNLFLGHERTRYVDRNSFQDWFQKQFKQNIPWNKVASSLIDVSGSLGESPQLNWFAKQKLDAANLADDTARFFLGVQLGCARCHNHPHDNWKLEDFYGLAAFYDGLERDKLSFTEKMKFRSAKKEREEMKEMFKGDAKKMLEDPKTRNEVRARVKNTMEEVRDIVRIVQDSDGSIDAEIQGQNKTYPAKFLMEPAPAHLSERPLKQLAAWITSPENPYFAKAFVNRVWAMMMGKGFVNPVDDMSPANAAVLPELMDELSNEFIQRNYDVRWLLSTIANSRVYQLSSQSTEPDEDKLYESGKLQLLNADQLLNSMSAATSIEKTFKLKSRNEYEERKEMVYRYYVFLFQNDDNQGNQEEFQGTIPQALFLMNGKATNEAIRPLPSNTTTRILSKLDQPEARIEELFLGTLSRMPMPEEMAKFAVYVAEKNNRAEAYEDVLWSLMNSHEFLFNH